MHGHSVGGTNPSLLRAIGAGTATTAFDVTFNREVLGADGRYFADAAALAEAIDDAEADPDETAARGVRLQRIASTNTAGTTSLTPTSPCAAGLSRAAASTAPSAAAAPARSRSSVRQYGSLDPQASDSRAEIRRARLRRRPAAA